MARLADRAGGSVMPLRARRQPTATSPFGVSRRERHDASAFYARFPPPQLSDDDEVSTASRAIDTVFCQDARSMPQVPDRSVALVVTSPPYFAGKEYEAALGTGHVPASYAAYLSMLEEVFAECVAKLEPGGRIAVNVANLGRKPYRSLAADVVSILQDRLRLLLRGEIVWVKGRGASGSCAWGSFCSPANPVVRDLTERVVIASKGRFDRAKSKAARRALGLPWRSSLTRDEFMEATTDVWEIPPERATRVGHPAPFPVELPERLIHLYTYVGDLVLDPFMGSGSTAVAAVRTGRHFVGYDTDPGYVERATRRVAGELARIGAKGGIDGPGHARLGVARSNATKDGAPRSRRTGPTRGVPRANAARGSSAEPQGARVAELRSARQLARLLLEEAGLAVQGEGVPLCPGVRADFVATDARRQRWSVFVVGSLTSVPSGLARVGEVWNVIGKAAVLERSGVGLSALVLTSHPVASSGGARAALRALTGPGLPIRAVVELQAPDAAAQLRTATRHG
jgi:DNA modification methylase